MHAMNRLGAVALLGVIAGTATAAEPMSAGECFLAGMKAGDADALSMCYAEDAVMWFPGGPMVKGRAAIREGYAGYLASVAIRDARLDAMGEESMGDTRVGWGNFEITMEDKATHAMTVERGRYTDVQKKIEGRWQYTVDHASDEPATPAK